VYVPRSYGRGLMPDSFADFKKQRFRWAYGAVLILRAHLGELLGLRATRLSRGQRYHFVAGWLPWLADGFNLAFNLAAIAWTVAMVVAPDRFAPPHPVFVALPLMLFVFKLTKLFFLYRWRVGASLRQSVAAGVAGLALSHVIARAMLTGLLDRGVAFFRTPKHAGTRGLLRALVDAREELFFLVVLVLGAIAVQLREDGDLFDVRLWATMLLVQGVPYLAAFVLSAISAARRLPGHWLGEMRQPLALPQA
jgi:hypothetical protein